MENTLYGRPVGYLGRSLPAANLVFVAAMFELANSLQSGAGVIETQSGHAPQRLMLGGLIVWIACMGLMLSN